MFLALIILEFRHNSALWSRLLSPSEWIRIITVNQKWIRIITVNKKDVNPYSIWIDGIRMD